MRIRREDEAVQSARIQDALHRAPLRGRPCFVGFLDEHEAAQAVSAARGANVLCWGGYPDAERVLFGAFPPEEAPDPAVFPLTALEITARRGTELTHRDLLGSLMALGVERDTVGDILIEQNRAVVFVRQELGAHLIAQLDRVGREGVQVQENPAPELPPPRPLIPISGTVASPRLDCVVTALARCGRSSAAEQIEGGLVARNGAVCDSVSASVAEGDVLVIRGEGKFVIQALGPLTKKQRLVFRAGKYS